MFDIDHRRGRRPGRTTRPLVRAVASTVAAALAASVFTIAAPAAAEDDSKSTCPDIHILAVQGTGQSSVDSPETWDTGELSSVVIPVLNAAEAEGFTVERTYVPYPADFGYQGVATAYKSSVLDGYTRLAQVAARVIYQCADTKLIVLGYSQGGHAVSMWAQQVTAGKAGAVTAANIALVVTFGDPTRSAGAPLFANRAGQVGPGPWPGLDRKTQPTATKFPDLYTSPTGQGIGPERDIATSFGALDGRVAQWCIEGDLSCSAPKSISLARTALAIAGQSSLDFTRDPFGVAATLAAATFNTIATGAATFATEDIEGTSLANVYFSSDASISQRLEDAADPRNTDTQTNPLVGVLKVGQILMSSVTSFLGTVFNSSTLSSLINAGATVLTSAATGAASAGIPALVGGPAAGAAAAAAGAAAGATSAAGSLVAPVVTLASNAVTAAVNIIPPQSASKKVSSVFDLLINEVKANADLPALLADARLWDQTSTHGGYRSARVAVDGSTPTDITTDWVIAAGRDYHAARIAREEKNKPKPTSATPVTATYDRTDNGAITTPDTALADTAKTDTPGDVRLLTAPAPAGTSPQPAAAVTWLPDNTESIAARLAAVEPTTPAGALLHYGSTLLIAVTAREKGTK